MGRCKRIRRRKRIVLRPVNCGCSLGYPDFFAWLKERGWHPSSKLGVARFPFIGRGIQAIEHVEEGATLAKVPSTLFITAETVLNSSLGNALNRDRNWDPQLLISLFLCWERHFGCESFWYLYLKMLPQSYDSPFFETENRLTFYNKPVQVNVKRITEKVNTFYREFLHKCRDCVCEHCGLKYFDIFTLRDFKWSWFTVNSRCVYIPSSERVLQSTHIALIPFVDLFNHSNSASVKVQMVENNFELITRIPFKKYDQVFINYGSHSNFTLMLEYGFIIPNNHHDVIEITIEDILSAVDCYLESKGSCSKYKYNFIKAHNLDKSLHCSAEGLSWNAEKVISVVLANDSENIHNIPYLEDLPEGIKTVMNDVGKFIINQKTLQLKNYLDILSNLESGKMSLLYKDYLEELLTVLGKCQKSLLSRINK